MKELAFLQKLKFYKSSIFSYIFLEKELNHEHILHLSKIQIVLKNDTKQTSFSEANYLTN